MIKHMKTVFSKPARLAALLTALSAIMGGVAFASDWIMQITIRSGPAETSVQIGSRIGASDWYDDALDAPMPIKPETLNAYLHHPEWDVMIDGMKQDFFFRDIRFSLPQDYEIRIEGGSGSVTIVWDRSYIPKDGEFWLYDVGSDTWVDMSKHENYTFTPSNDPSTVTVRATWGDTCCFPLPMSEH